MNDTVVAIVSAFFLIGITVGIVAVVAVSVLRADRRGDQGDYAHLYDDDPYRPGAPPSGAGRDDTAPDGHPRWPGDADNHFHGR